MGYKKVHAKSSSNKNASNKGPNMGNKGEIKEEREEKKTEKQQKGHQVDIRKLFIGWKEEKDTDKEKDKK
eukprot:1309731-Ditylum_brightwellii.AAC.1